MTTSRAPRGRMRRLWGAALAATVLLLPGCAVFDGIGGDDLGGEGDEVHLTIGYQPYYTEAWSGLVMRGKEFWKEHLPEGSTVEFKVGLQGSVIVTDMLAGKVDIGYAGDMPSIVGASKRDIRDLRIVSTLGIANDQCGIFLVRPDAPDFASQEEALKWFDGKTIATPQGSCTDRVAQATFEQVGAKPKEYLNQAIDVITSNLDSGKLDGAIIWEPTASKLVNAGLAKRVASGAFSDQLDAGFMLMDNELIEKRPDVAEAWLKAELDAQKFLADPANADEIVEIALEQTEGFSEKDLRDSLYRRWTVAEGGNEEGNRIRLPFVIDEDSQALIEYAARFLNQIDAIPDPELPDGAVHPDIARKVLEESDVPDGPGTVVAQ